jgi:hypothetical protein
MGSDSDSRVGSVLHRDNDLVSARLHGWEADTITLGAGSFTVVDANSFDDATRKEDQKLVAVQRPMSSKTPGNG